MLIKENENTVLNEEMFNTITLLSHGSGDDEVEGDWDDEDDEDFDDRAEDENDLHEIQLDNDIFDPDDDDHLPDDDLE
jgi:hypothetical protein